MTKKEFTYNTQGVCSSQIHIKLSGDIIDKIEFTGGCNGNAQGISKLIIGMKVADVIKKLKGVSCGNRNTSCPDQLTKALESVIS
ncbi:TIGR03905 family TSCPD domain-containing protein [Alkalibaculum sp. M08DMB]|uniref:ribonucleoside-diphosphate reductase n=1 Tax=Alkalibaculum sporogenes TaxID=2655001 RepID=A0A6A7K4W0_9FIRM|nr:TIGR03905 family TSCPD domain-containing protein [Alkalibaculum sporogenes]MPW24496.1 TIGR03905 family TSCPD domain-containing protein [Alkalibaculum sporogenes]